MLTIVNHLIFWTVEGRSGQSMATGVLMSAYADIFSAALPKKAIFYPRRSENSSGQEAGANIAKLPVLFSLQS